MAHPHSGDTLRRAALKSGYAAEMREQRKVKKYGQQQSQSGTHPPCIPLVFEYFGFWELKNIWTVYPRNRRMSMEGTTKLTFKIDGENSCLLLFSHVTLV